MKRYKLNFKNASVHRQILFCRLAILFIFFFLQVSGFAQTPSLKYVLKSHEGLITSVSFSPNNRLLASASIDRTIRLWNVADGKPVKILRGHTREVNAVVFSPDNRFVVSSSYDGQLFIWEVLSGQVKRKIKLPLWSIVLAVASDGNVVAGCQDGSIVVVNIQSGQTVRTFKSEFAINALAFSPNGQYLVTAGPIIIWNYRTGEKFKSLPGGAGGILGLAITPDGKSIVTGHWRLNLRIWDFESGKQTDMLTNKISRRVSGVSGNEPVELDMPLASMALSPDGKYVLAGDIFKTIHVWDLTDRKITKKLEEHTAQVNALAFSPDGKHFASGSSDRTIRLWNF